MEKRQEGMGQMILPKRCYPPFAVIDFQPAAHISQLHVESSTVYWSPIKVQCTLHAGRYLTSVIGQELDMCHAFNAIKRLAGWRG